MGRPNKFDEVVVPAGKTMAEYFAERLNELGSMERLAVEIGVSYQTMFNWCKRLGVTSRTEYYVELPDAEAV